MAFKIQAIPVRPSNRIRESSVDRIFMGALYIGLGLVLLGLLYPMIYVVSASISDPSAVMSGEVVLWPVGFNLNAYETIMNYEQIWVGFANSIYYTVFGTLVNVVMTILAGFALSRMNLVGRNFFMFLFAFTLLFNGGLVPTYLLVHDLGLIDNRMALILPQAISVFNLLITVTYFRTSIPEELMDAARLDGCDDIQSLIKVVLPLSAPIIAVLTLFYAVGNWNQYFSALIYISNPDLQPLQIILRTILIQNQVDLSTMMDVNSYAARVSMIVLLKNALIVVASVPVLILYPFVQKYFVKGIMIGAIKG